MNDCLFCKIIAGEIPCEKVYEDEHTLAFLDIKPVNFGHTLVVPKEHYLNALDVPEAVFMQMISTAKKVGHTFKKGLGVDDFNIAMNNGTNAGQMVFHAHLHVIPRVAGDGFAMWHGKRGYEGTESHDTAEKLKNALG
jgi:histidine triad (HIT) family protein